MKSAITFTSSLPQQLLQELDNYAKKLKKNKNQLLEAALKRYLHELKRLEYIQSFKKASKDEDLKNLSEAGLNDYLDMLKQNEI